MVAEILPFFKFVPKQSLISSSNVLFYSKLYCKTSRSLIDNVVFIEKVPVVQVEDNAIQ